MGPPQLPIVFQDVVQQLPEHAVGFKDFLPTFFGALFGAIGAFCVGWLKENRDEKKRRHTALLAAQYALYSEWSVIEDIRKSFLEPFRNDSLRHLRQKYFMRTLGHLSVPFDELTFIIDSGTPNLLQDIHVAEKRFLMSIDILNRINDLRLELQKKYPPVNFDMISGKGQITVPVHEIFALKELTDMLYDEVGKALPELWETNLAIEKFIKINLKGRKPAKFAPLDQGPS